jgi:hypothetical protein
MIHQCSNPTCSKPFHSLREGRIFVFDLPDKDSSAAAPGGHTRRMRHFWLCSACSQTLVLEQTAEKEIRIALKAARFTSQTSPALPDTLAS